ncbi:peptidoglycan-binding protein [Arthrobacter sp. 9V]|uniref:peptidoglycan-binding protein n=1 Tax=Arthrobacter sp. 9V TaxID=2653132 RepID=UPI001358D2A6|nr:peptidoglycan-binding protein [Arthrobacter sp. 9V]
MAVALVLSGLVAAYWAGSQAAALATSQQDVTAVIPVSATVERRAVAQQVTLAGMVVAGNTSPVTASLADGTDRLILTSTPKAVGDFVEPGELLAVVSGHPLLVMPASVPLYRDIIPGDSGPDVRALQAALAGLGLAVKTNGTFDQQTQQALKTWYGNAGFPAPVPPASAPTESTNMAGAKAAPAAMVRWRDFVQVPGDAGRIASLAGTGAVLAEDGVVAQISVSDDTIVARADVLQAESFAVGTSVTVRAGALAVTTTVTAVGGFTEGDSSRNIIPGMDITASIPPGTTGLAPQQSVTVTSGNAPAETLAVPLLAIRQEMGVAYVQVAGEAGPHRVDVTVTAQADGWAAIDNVEGLDVGVKVMLP